MKNWLLVVVACSTYIAVNAKMTDSEMSIDQASVGQEKSYQEYLYIKSRNMTEKQYQSRVAYLENELKKMQDKTLSDAQFYNKKVDYLERQVANKTNEVEILRDLIDKIPKGVELKKYISANMKMVEELREKQALLAEEQYKATHPTGGRLPASINQK